MNKIAKHIAILLLGIFIFPIFYQSVHIVWHHSHECCEHGCYNDKTHELSVSDQTQSVFIFSAINHCPICEYQFAANSLHEVIYYEIIISLSNTNYYETLVAQLHKKIINFKSPRAPPSFLLS